MTTTPTGWRSQTIVNTFQAGAQSDGQIVAFSNGGYAVIYTDGPRIFAWSYDALGNRVTGPVSISPSTITASSPAVTSLNDGSFAIAYVHHDGSDTDIVVRRFSEDMGFLGQTTIDSGANQTVDPAIATFADGSYIVSYTIGSGSDTDIVARIVSADGVVGGQFDIHDQSDNSWRSQLATLANGNFVAVFEDEDKGNAADTDIVLRIFDSTGTPVTGPITVDDNSHLDSDPDVAALAGGNFVVVWSNAIGDGSGEGIRARVFNGAGAAQGAAFTVNTTIAGNQNEPNVVALADGGFVVTWEDDNANLMRAQRFDASGSRIGSEFIVQDGVDPNHTAETALLSDGRFAYAIGDVIYGTADVTTSIWDPRTGPIVGTPGPDVITSRLDGATLFGGDGDDTLYGMFGNDTLDGGVGNDMMTGGYGNDTVIFARGYGRDTITDFTRGEDQIDLRSYAGLTFANVLARATQDGSDTVINFGSGDVLVLQDVQRSDLAAGDFLLRTVTVYDHDNKHPWTEATSAYDAAGKLDYVTIKNDDGRTFFTNYDQDNEYSWRQASSTYDARGKLEFVTIKGDDGKTFVTSYDPHGVLSWSQAISGYDDQGRLDYVTVIFDDGTTAYTDYDQANTSNVNYAVYHYDAHNNLVSSFIAYDDGTTLAG